MTTASRTAEEKRCYRVRGPYLLQDQSPPPDELKLIAKALSRLRSISVISERKNGRGGLKLRLTLRALMR